MKNKKILHRILLILVVFMLALILKVPKVEANEQLIWPVPGHNTRSQGLHDRCAIDISDGSIAGANVYAAMGGTVKYIYLCGAQHYGSEGDCHGFGTGIVIQGTDGRSYQYAHMQAGSIPSNVYHGATVQKGQLIGRVGTTGNSSGPHLHFGICYGNYWEGTGNPDNETYVDVATTSPWYSSMKLNNIGDNFYGLLIVNSTGRPVSDEGDILKLIYQKNNYANQVWNFQRQSDGSYIIKNCGTGKYLDVYGYNDYDGGKIWTYPYNGSTAQRWYIYGPGTGEFILKPKCSDRVLDLYLGQSILNLWSYNGSNAQKFAIKKLPKVGKSTLKVSYTNEKTTFNWTKANNATGYDLRIRSGSAGNTYLYKEFLGITGTSKSISLPAGYYEVYVSSKNYYDTLASNTLKFNITKTQSINTKTDLSKVTVTVNTRDKIYNGKAIKTSVSLKYGSKILKNGTDYTVSYKNNINPGTATLTITGKGNYKGTISKKFKIVVNKVKELKTSSQSTSAINIKWAKVNAITGYEVYMATSKNGKYSKVKTITKNSTTQYKKTGLTPGKTYYFKVRAYKTINGKKYYGSYSNIIQSKTKVLNPSKVKGLKAKNQTTTSITLNWSKASGATGYEVYKYNSSKKKWEKVGSTTKTSYTVNKLKAGTKYIFKVRAYKTVSKKKYYGSYSSELQTATKTSTPKITSITTGSKKANLQWKKVSGATGYEIYMATSKNGKYSKVKTITNSSTVKYSKTKLNKNKKYYFKIRTYKTVNGKKIYSSYSSVKSIIIK